MASPNYRLLLRNLHIKIGAIIAVPLLIASVSALLLAHNHPLGFDRMQVNMSWLPGGQLLGTENVLATVQATLRTRNGHTLVGTRYGLYELQNEQLTRIDILPALDVRSLHESAKGVLVAGKGGVWLQDTSGWRQVYTEEAWQAEWLPDQTLQVLSKKQGLLTSRDAGQHWTAVSAVNEPLRQAALEIDTQSVPLTRLLFDIHSGNIVLGKSWRWIWVDLVAAPLLFLSLSGLWLWYRSKKRAR